MIKTDQGVLKGIIQVIYRYIQSENPVYRFVCLKLNLSLHTEQVFLTKSQTVTYVYKPQDFVFSTPPSANHPSLHCFSLGVDFNSLPVPHVISHAFFVKGTNYIPTIFCWKPIFFINMFCYISHPHTFWNDDVCLWIWVCGLYIYIYIYIYIFVLNHILIFLYISYT